MNQQLEPLQDFEVVENVSTVEVWQMLGNVKIEVKSVSDEGILITETKTDETDDVFFDRQLWHDLERLRSNGYVKNGERRSINMIEGSYLLALQRFIKLGDNQARKHAQVIAKAYTNSQLYEMMKSLRENNAPFN
jgi:hypothetical protein